MLKKEKILLILFLALIFSLILVQQYKPIDISKDNELILGISPFTVTIDNETGEQIYVTGKAKVLIAHPNENWRIEEIFDPNGIVAHKAAVGDIDNDGNIEMVSIYSCVPRDVNDPSKGLLIPINIKKFDFENGVFNEEIIYSINDTDPSNCFITERSADIGDVDNDGENELVIGTHEMGIYIIKYNENKWESNIIDKDPNAGIHTLIIADADGDNRNEIISASDGDNTVKMHEFDGEWISKDIFNTTKEDITWAMDFGNVDND